MTPQQAKELLPIITAFAEGKEIEINVASDKSEPRWIKIHDNPTFEGKIENYRIKPEPREWWLLVAVGQRAMPEVFDSEKEVKNHVKELKESYYRTTDFEIVHVKQVD